MRKLGIIMLSAFAHDHSLQLHFTSFVLVAAFALHSIYLPFETKMYTDRIPRKLSHSRKTCSSHLRDTIRWLCSCCSCSRHIVSEGDTLHRMERNSILICTLLLWSAVVFVLIPTCNTDACATLSALCVFALVSSNMVFILVGVCNYVRFWRGKKVGGRMAGDNIHEGSFQEWNYVINPIQSREGALKVVEAWERGDYQMTAVDVLASGGEEKHSTTIQTGKKGKTRKKGKGEEAEEEDGEEEEEEEEEEEVDDDDGWGKTKCCCVTCGGTMLLFSQDHS